MLLTCRAVRPLANLAVDTAEFLTGAFRYARRPIVLDQVVYSGSNALLVILLPAFLSGEAFSRYALFQALAMTLVSAQRALVGEPSLVLRRTGEFPSPFRPWLLLILAIFLVLGGLVPLAHIALAVPLTLAPVLQDSLRYRALLYGRIRVVLAADTLMFLTTLAGIGVLRPNDMNGAILCWTVPALISCSLLLIKRPRGVYSGLKDILNIGRFGLSDVLVAASISVGPLALV